MTIDVSVSATSEESSPSQSGILIKKDRKRGSVNPSSEQSIKVTTHSMSPMMTSSVPSVGEHHHHHHSGGLLTLGPHQVRHHQFGNMMPIPQIGSHLSAFTNHLSLKNISDSRPHSRSSSEAAEDQSRPKSGRSNSTPTYSPLSSPKPENRHRQSKHDSDSDIDVDDNDDHDQEHQRKKRFKKRTSNEICSEARRSSGPPNLSSSFFINDILKSSSSPPTDLQSAFLRSTAAAAAGIHPHLSPPSTPPNVSSHAFSVQELSLRAAMQHNPSAASAAHPSNAYSLFAAAVAAATGGKPNVADPAAFAAAQQSVAAGFFGSNGQQFLPHAAALGAMGRPSPFGAMNMPPLGLMGMPHHEQAAFMTGQLPGSGPALTGDCSDAEMDPDGDDDVCSSTDGDEDRKGKTHLECLKYFKVRLL